MVVFDILYSYTTEY